MLNASSLSLQASLYLHVSHEIVTPESYNKHHGNWHTYAEGMQQIKFGSGVVQEDAPFQG